MTDHKLCKGCDTLKELTDFYKNKARASKKNPEGIDTYCKACSKERRRKRLKTEEGRLKHNERARRYRNENKEASLAYERRWREENKEHLASYRRERRGYNRDYMRMRREDPVFRLRGNVSRNISLALEGISKGKKTKRRTFDYLPYSPQDLVEHLEYQFDDKMSWDNYGTYWHLDHIYPQSLLPYDSYEHPNFLRCWARDNLRPLEARENIVKSNKIIKTQERVIAIDL